MSPIDGFQHVLDVESVQFYTVLQVLVLHPVAEGVILE